MLHFKQVFDKHQQVLNPTHLSKVSAEIKSDINPSDSTTFQKEKVSCATDYNQDSFDACIVAVKDLIKKIHEHL